ncbi:lactonase family protein [Nocardiopsis exhalans]|uniref:Lactonase family protein n=1 Tax=Nocardiopsis exhalans TaxID=163604 RepID=A0ABY5DE89_9ACTN|nr:lactonase family protein [Nocardiopsis exhalans]USY21684.1 lactonase family protein [Nocardiopsis exhalans]
MDTPRRLLLVGTYTPDSDPPGEGQGIHRVWFDPETGELTADGVAARTTGPSFLDFAEDPPTVYAVNERAKGTVTAFRVHGDASLTELGSLPTEGGSPCHVLDLGDGLAGVADYANGTAAVVAFTLDGSGGTDDGEPWQLFEHSGSGPVTDRQEGSHAHSLTLAPDTGNPELSYLLVADLGTDELRVYQVANPHPPELPADSEGPGMVFVPGGLQGVIALPPGTGPRHAALHPSGAYVYVVGELDSRVHVLSWDGREGTGEYLGSLPATAEEAAGSNFPAEITLHRDRVYVSNRGADVISTFAVREEGARLEHLADTPVGAWPRHFTVVRGHNGQPDHLVAAAQNGDSLMSLRIDPDTGIPADTGHRLDMPVPVCVLPVPIKRIRRAEAEGGAEA